MPGTLLKQGLILLLSGQLLACGFSLQGQQTGALSAELGTLYLNAGESNTELARHLRRTLEQAGATVRESPAAGLPELRLGAEDRNERVVSLGGDGRAGEYELTLSSRVSLHHDGDTLFGPQTLSRQSLYLADPVNPLAKSREQELLLAEMRRELATQILRRLQALP